MFQLWCHHKLFVIRNLLLCGYCIQHIKQICIGCIWQCVLLKSAFSVRDNSNDRLFSHLNACVSVNVCLASCMHDKYISTPRWFSFYLLFTDTHSFPLHNFQHTVKNLHWNVNCEKKRRNREKREPCRNCTHLMHHKTQAGKQAKKNKTRRRMIMIIKDCKFIVRTVEHCTSLYHI